MTTSTVTTTTSTTGPARVIPTSGDEAQQWHGYMLRDAGLPLPYCVVSSEELSRPDYTQTKSSEFCDHPDVLDAKADLLIQLMTSSSNMMVYAGAGISTSSGIQDYASKAKGSLVQQKKNRLTMDFICSLKPTPAHRILTSLEKLGIVKHWLQQNHDGLPQEAGFPQSKINEVHGTWHDEQNPVIKMDGNLRGDLFEWMLEWEKKADFIFALGTSFSGMNADRCAEACAQRHIKKGKGLGVANLTIQQTPFDPKCCLRIFSRIDDFMNIVATKMNLVIDPTTYEIPNSKYSRFRESQRIFLPVKQEDTTAVVEAVKTSKTTVPVGKPTTTTNAPTSVEATGSSPDASITVAKGIPTTVSLAPSVRLSIGNTATPSQKTKGNVNWKVFVKGATAKDAALVRKYVKSVTFGLHPTFTPQTVTVDATQTDSDGEFYISRCGWGTFPVEVTVTLASGTELKHSHDLSFDQDTQTTVDVTL